MWRATTFTAAPGYGEKIVESLQALPNVQYRGQVAPDEAIRVISDAAFFLSTSDEEGFPNTFLQAWAAGTPVISLRIDPDQVIERYALGRVSCTVQQAIIDIRDFLVRLKREKLYLDAQDNMWQIITALLLSLACLRMSHSVFSLR